MTEDIRYLDSADSIVATQLGGGFFENWPNPPSPVQHLKILQNSQYRIIALDPQSQQVIGFINALSDGVLTAYIPLLEVLPAWRNKGIASELVRRINEQLSQHYMIDIVCDQSLTRFYEQFGFQSYTAMIQRHYSNQAGIK